MDFFSPSFFVEEEVWSLSKRIFFFYVFVSQNFSPLFRGLSHIVI